MTQIYPLFSSPVYHVDDIGYRPSDELIATLESLPSSKSWSHSGLTKDERILDREDMQELKGICQHYLSDYIKTVCGYKENFIITNSWLSRNPKFQGHNQHNHANSIFSGCLYLKANKDTAPIQFRSKNRLSKDFNFAYEIETSNVFNASEWTVPVSTGSLVIFPSYLHHGSLPNLDDTTRICLGFNSFVQDRFGGINYSSDVDLSSVK
jgi:uncharacterized protein (TIGR02466 family)